MQDIYLKKTPIKPDEDITQFVGRVIAEYEGEVSLLPINDATEYLIERKAIYEYLPGQYIYLEKSSQIVHGIINMLYNEIAKPLGFSRWIFPRLHKLQTADMFGLIEAWPFYLLKVGAYDYSRKIQTIESGYVLDPVQCMAFYQFLKENKEFRKKPLKIFEIAGGFTYRNEDKDKLNGIFKTVEFLRVEILYYDTREKIVEIRQQVMNKLLELLTQLNIKWRVVIGMGCYEYPSKQELCKFYEASKVGEIPVLDIEVLVKNRGKEEWIELAGCALEYDLKVKRFGIEDGLESGCVGVGINRFLGAIASYYDIDKPESLPEIFKKYMEV